LAHVRMSNAALSCEVLARSAVMTTVSFAVAPDRACVMTTMNSDTDVPEETMGGEMLIVGVLLALNANAGPSICVQLYERSEAAMLGFDWTAVNVT